MPNRPEGTIMYTVLPGDTLKLIAQRFHTTVYAIATMNPELSISPIFTGQKIYIKPEEGFSPLSSFKTIDENYETAQNLKEDLRSLWEQHIAWTRTVITSIVFGLPNLDAVTNRLLINPTDFKNALLPYYSSEVASKFAELLNSHLVIAAQLVKTAKTGNRDATSKLEKSWYANVDEIAAVLSSINPYWSEEDWKRMLYEHLSLTIDEAVYMLNKKYKEDISNYNEIEKEALAMADTMTNGIIRQFPNKFYR